MADLGAIGIRVSANKNHTLDNIAAHPIALNPIGGINPYTFSVKPYGENWKTISGTVQDINGAFVARTVAVFEEVSRVLVGVTMSNASTGAYSIKTPYTGQHFVIAFDPSENAVIFDRVVPV